MTFGERLRGIRVINGMTQEDLAKRVSLEKMSISKYESGKMMPSSSTLVALCNVFGVGADYFFRESKVHITADPNYRKSANISKSEELRITQQTEHAVGNLLEISEICPREREPASPEKLRKHVVNMDDIESLAEKVREKWSLGNDPIENLMEVAENNGFTIILVDALKSFDAALYNDDIYGPIIALRRKNVPKDRQRFTLAHELGHYFILNKECDAKERWTPETRANRFAAALLVPKKNLIDDIGKNRTILTADELYMLSDKYGISIPALLVRMVSLNIISKALKAKLEAYITAELVDTSIRSTTNEEPRLVRKLVNRAVAEGYISERKGIELLEDGFFGTSPMVNKQGVHA